MTENGDPFTSYQWIQNSVGTNNSKNSDIQIVSPEECYLYLNLFFMDY